MEEAKYLLIHLINYFMETLEFLKWFSGRSFSYLTLSAGFADEHMRNVIDNEMIMQLEYTKRFHNFDLTVNILSGDYDPKLVSFMKSLDADDMERMRTDFKPGHYSSFPLYTCCSLKLNKEFRRVNDQISSFVYGS